MLSRRFLLPRVVALAALLLGGLIHLATPPAPRAASSDCTGGQTICSHAESCDWILFGYHWVKVPIRICTSTTYYFGP